MGEVQKEEENKILKGRELKIIAMIKCNISQLL